MAFNDVNSRNTENAALNMNDFGTRLSSLRRSCSLTQEGLASLLGVTFQAVSKWETGNSLPDVANLPPLAAALGVSIDELLTGKKAGDRPQPVRSSAALFGAPLPWEDDGAYHIAVFRGMKLLSETGYSDDDESEEIRVVLEGTPANVTSSLSVTVCGSVAGDVNAASCTVEGDVGGNLQAAACTVGGDVRGSVKAAACTVNGNVAGDCGAANCTVNGNVNGSVLADGDVTVKGSVGGSVTAGKLFHGSVTGQN